MQKQMAFEIKDEKLVPPVGNTGAQSTGQRILIDWLAFTLPSFNELNNMFNILGVPGTDWIALETRTMGYNAMYTHGEIKVYTAERQDMGIHCELSGSACREYEFFFGDNWQQLIKRVKENQGHFTRIDIAVDDFEGIFTLEQIEQKVKNTELISYFRKGRILEEFNLAEKDNLGKTIYFGSPKSRIRIRMYDKAIETMLKEQSSREAAAIEKESKEKAASAQRKINKKNREEQYRQERLNQKQIWNRTEIQSRDERAEAISDYILIGMEIGPVIFGVLKNYLNFLEKSASDSNKSRWPVAEFWQKFLGQVEKLKLTIETKHRTIKKIKEWIIRQVAPSLALLSLEKDRQLNLTQIAEITIFAVNRLKQRHFELLETA